MSLRYELLIQEMSKTVPLGTVFVVESVPEWVAEVFEVYEVSKMSKKNSRCLWHLRYFI